MPSSPNSAVPRRPNSVLHYPLKTYGVHAFTSGTVVCCDAIACH
jgi:hypothetical protein